MRFGSRLGVTVLGWVSLAITEAIGEVRNVAIIGAGAAGSSAAYHLQKYAAEENLAINITIFEKTDRIGGRSLTVNAYDDPSQPIELGASIFVKVNHILHQAASDFNLPLGSLSSENPGDITAIWDGERIVFQTVAGQSFWRDAAKMIWRYGPSPYYATKLVKDTVGKFLKLYEEPWFPFESLTQRAFELGLTEITSMTGAQFLAENKINKKFCDDILQAATRVNYASNLAYIHGLEAMVSSATDGAVTIRDGNWKIFDNMVRHSGASLYRNTTVTSMSFAKDDGSESKRQKYAVSTKLAGATTTNTDGYPISFDNIIVASPWQYSDIAAEDGIIKERIDEIPYTKLHVTLFASPFKLSAAAFNLSPGSKAPSSVYTTLNPRDRPKPGAEGVGSAGYYSISTLRTLLNPNTGRREYVYKVFSPDVVTPGFLSKMLGTEIPDTFTSSVETRGVAPISWYHPAWFHSYPIELPRVTFQDPIVGKGIYYTSGIESFISTMETSALMGKNVARLIADNHAGIRREPVVTEMGDFQGDAYTCQGYGGGSRGDDGSEGWGCLSREATLRMKKGEAGEL